MSDVRDEIILHQRENEMNFLASAFTLSSSVVVECGWLHPDMLVDPDVAAFWKSLLEQGDPMRAANSTRTMSKVMSAMAETVNTSFYTEYARAIAEDYFLLNVMEKLGTIATNASDHNVSGIMAALDELRSTTIPGYHTGISAEIASQRFDSLIDRVIAGENLSVLSNIPGLDNEIGGFFRSELSVLAARPSVGKTALLLQIARNASLKGLVLFFSLEMSAEQVWARMACPLAGYSWTDVRAGNVSKEGLARIKAASADLRYKYANNLIIIDSAFTVQDIHQISAQYRPVLVLIDQLGDIVWHNPSESQVVWYGLAVKHLRHYVARGLDVPVILNHHINRAVEAREDKKPQLSDLRWSGDIEQKADVVLLAYRRDMWDGRGAEQYDVPLEIKVAKNRQGEAGGTAVLNYNLKEQWFS